MKINTALVQVTEKCNKILTTPCHAVNMRLVRSNESYRKIIVNIIQHMLSVLCTKFSDYAELKGISGANVGIPFNIVIVKQKERYLVMINPEILAKSKETYKAMSNCGSINLEKSIEVVRHKEVLVRYTPYENDTFLSPIEKVFTSATIQHEVEHNLGILITSK